MSRRKESIGQKLLGFWRRLTGKYLDPTKMEKGHSSLYVINVNPESTELAGALGIDDERREWLNRLARNSFNNNDDVVSTIAEFSKEIGHANELAYCIYVTSARHLEASSGPGAMLAKLLSREK